MNFKSLFTTTKATSLDNTNRRVQKNPQDFLALIDRADAFMEQHDAKSALQDIERAQQLIQIKFSDRIPDANRRIILAKLHTIQSRALHALGNLSGALDAVGHALSENPSDLDANTQQGRIQRDLGQYELARQTFDRVIEHNPRFAQAHVAKGMLLQEIGHPQDAIREYDAALDIDRSLSIAWSSRGSAYFSLKNFDQAESDLLTAIQIDPYLGSATIKLSWIQRVIRKDARRALALLEAGLQYNPQDSAMRVAMARLDIDAGKINEALSILNSVLEKEPQNSEALSVRGQVHGRLGKMDAAIRDMDRAAELFPRDTENLLNLAVAHVYDKDPGSAIRTLERLLEQNPADMEARSLLKQLKPE